MYLFHTQTLDAKAGIGRWVIGDIFASKDMARAFVDSWAVTPYFTAEASDGAGREPSLWNVIILIFLSTEGVKVAELL